MQPRRSSGRPLLRRLVSDSAIYGLGGVSNQVLAVLLVPVYANVLGVADFGVLAIINTTLALGTMIVTLALPQAFFRSYLMDSQEPLERARVLRTAFGLRLMVSVGGLLGMAALAIPLTALLFGDMRSLPLLLLVAPIVFFDTVKTVPLSFLRAERRPRAYATLAFTRAVLGSILIIACVVVLDLGVVGVLLGGLGAAMIVAAAGLAILGPVGGLRAELDPQLVRRMLVFSLPLVPASIAGWTLNLSDRYLLQAIDSPSAVGIYSAGYSLGQVISALAIAPFTLAWGAAFWEIARSPDARATYARVMTVFVLLTTFVALGISAFSTDLLRLVFLPEFEPARFVVPFSAFAYVLYGAYTIGATGLNVEGRTGLLPVTLGISAVANVVLNFALIPAFGYMGAAAATLLSYSLLTVLTSAVGQRHYPVPWDIPRTVGALGLGMGLALASLVGPDHLAWRVACVGAYPVLLLPLRIVGRSDVAWLQTRLRRFRGG